MDRVVALIVLLAACVPEEQPAVRLRASSIVDAPGHTGAGTADATRAVNGVRGGGRTGGSTDVFSLGFTPDVDGHLTLGFEGHAVDVEGPDLVVFENPFEIDAGGRFMDPTVVEVSADCERFVAFPHWRADSEPDQWSDDPESWAGFAGLEPVLLHEEDNPVDPLSTAAGGDAFDLADLDPMDPVATEVLRNGVACVRLSGAGLWIDPGTGEPFPGHPIGNGPDIDGIYASEVIQ